MSVSVHRAEFPSLGELVSQSREVQYYPFAYRLSGAQELSLRRKFHIKYFCLSEGPLLHCTGLDTNSPPKTISIRDLASDDLTTFIEFTEKTFYDANQNEYGQADRGFFRAASDEYFKIPLFGKVYSKNDQTGAIIATHVYNPHPATQYNTLHIGYWGYDRTGATRDEAISIKIDWVRSLRTWSQNAGNIPIDASVDYFNEPAFKFSSSLGFKIHSLRLDKRPIRMLTSPE